MTLAQFNALPEAAAGSVLLACCGSTRWARQMALERPFATHDDLAVRADAIWWSLGAEDWREAFAAHPRIGDDVRQGQPREASAGNGVKATRVGSASDRPHAFSAAEQAGMQSASASVRERLAKENRDYESRFGYIFIVCASGRSADEMLELLEGRLSNAPDAELRIAAEEQRRITRLRLEKLLT